MTLIKTGENWLDTLCPLGIPTHTSLLISGPGGSGKPLIELAFVRTWLLNGGSVLGIPLQYPSLTMIKKSMEKIYHFSMDDYQSHTAYIQFNPNINDVRQIDSKILEANMLLPNVWDEAITWGSKLVEPSDLGLLVYGSALNLLLFSSDHKQAILDHLEAVIRSDKSKTYLFTISNNVFSSEMHRLEAAADHLFMTHLEPQKQLKLRIERMRGVPYLSDEITVPIDSKLLEEVSAIAQQNRIRRVKDIQKN